MSDSITESNQHADLGNPRPSASAPIRDPYTGLYQQDYLVQALEHALNQCVKGEIVATLGLLQLENFYEIRSWVGKSEANLLLSDIAYVLQKSLPDSVLLCRCHHYEFGVLLLNNHSINARLITDRVKLALLRAVSDSIPPQLELKCAVGLAGLESNIPSAEAMFARARHNLSLRHCHRYRELVHSPITPEVALQRLRAALQENKLQLSFQPTVSLQVDELQHYEIRCHLAPGEDLLPTRLLIETAARNALGEDIDRLIIRRAIGLLQGKGQGKGQEKEREKLRLTINISHNSLVSPKFFDWIQAQLINRPNIASQLVFQLSEIDVLIAQHHMGNFCHQLQQLKLKLSISNFGCTNDPFRYLSLLNAHFVKLDASLLERLSTQSDTKQLSSTIDRLHENGLLVIAAMVEKMSLLPLLWRARTDFVQGNCLQEPSSSMGFAFLKEETLSFH